MVFFNVLSHIDKISSELILITDSKTPLPTPKEKKKFDNILNKPATANKQNVGKHQTF